MNSRLRAVTFMAFALALVAPLALRAQAPIPDNNAVGIDPTNCGLSWQPATGDFLYYDLKLQAVGDQPVITQVMAPPVVFTNLQPSTVYIWSVGVVTADGETWLGPWSFQTAAGALASGTVVEPEVVYEDVPDTLYIISAFGITFYYHTGHPHPNDVLFRPHHPWWWIRIVWRPPHPSGWNGNHPHPGTPPPHPDATTPPHSGTSGASTTTTTTTHHNFFTSLASHLTHSSHNSQTSDTSSSSDNGKPSDNGNPSDNGKPTPSGGHDNPTPSGGHDNSSTYGGHDNPTDTHHGG